MLATVKRAALYAVFQIGIEKNCRGLTEFSNFIKLLGGA